MRVVSFVCFVFAQEKGREPSAGEPGLSKPQLDYKHEKTEDGADDGISLLSTVGAAAEVGEPGKGPIGDLISSAVAEDGDGGRNARSTLVGRDAPQVVPDWLADPVAFVSQIVSRVQEGGGVKCLRRSRAPPPPTRNFPQSVVARA